MVHLGGEVTVAEEVAHHIVPSSLSWVSIPEYSLSWWGGQGAVHYHIHQEAEKDE